MNNDAIRAPIRLIAIAVVLALTVTGCGRPPQPGRVTARWVTCSDRLLGCQFHLQTNKGHRISQGTVSEAAYRRCRDGEQYPQCVN